MTTRTREEAHKRHVALLAETARKVTNTHRSVGRHTATHASFACKINDHLSCLVGACDCGCHA